MSRDRSDLEALNILHQALIDALPDAEVELQTWGTGRFGNPHGFLDVVIKEKHYAVEYVSGEGFGVTRVTAENSFLRGSEAVFTTAREAQDYLLRRIEAEQT